MSELVVVLGPRDGLHARAAAAVVREASRYDAHVTVTNLTRDPSRTASAASILGLLGLAAAPGHRLRLTAEGRDARRAVDSIGDLLERGVEATTARDLGGR